MQSFPIFLVLGAVAIAQPLFAQRGESRPVVVAAVSDATAPLDGIYARTIEKERRVLAYDHVREADVVWEKRIWRLVDMRERMNLHFAYPKLPFFQIVIDAVKSGGLTVYSDEGFKQKYSPGEASQILGRKDTIVLVDDQSEEMKTKVIEQQLDIAAIQRFRIKEVWFFDKESSRMQVRILGIAPLLAKYGDDGEFQFEYPLFWIYYPHARQLLASHDAFLGDNEAGHMSWEDIFEMRYFSGLITKQSNVRDNRIQDVYTGRNALLEAEKIHQEIFNYEQDLWVD